MDMVCEFGHHSYLICVNIDGETGTGQPPCVGSSLPLRWLPFRSHGPPIRRYTGCEPNHPGDDCGLDCTQHERLYW